MYVRLFSQVFARCILQLFSIVTFVSRQFPLSDDPFQCHQENRNSGCGKGKLSPAPNTLLGMLFKSQELYGLVFTRV